MKIGVTGAAGGIGSILADHLFELGYELVLIDDLSTGSLLNLRNEQNRKNLIVNDLSEFSVVLKSLENCNLIFHLAAISSLAQCQLDPAKAISVNVGSTAVICEIARITGAQVIFASTSAVYERNTTLPYSESDSVGPVLVYPFSKLTAEQHLRNSFESCGVSSTIFRFFNVFGPRQDFRRPGPPLVNFVVREICMGREVIIYAPMHQARDYVYVNDVVELLTSVVTQNKVEGCVTLNVASGRLITVQEILQAVEGGLGCEIHVRQSTPSLLWERHKALFEGCFPLNSQIVVDEALKQSLGSIATCKQLLGWEATSDVLVKIVEDAPAMAAEVIAAAKRGEIS